MSKDKLKVGVIGVGYLGKFHAQKYSLMDNVNLVGVADINEQQAKNVAKELQTDAYIDHKELIRKIEAASIVVPTPAHFSISKECLESDVDILIEKPMAATVEEADELMIQARAKVDGEKRKALYEEFQRLFAEEVPALLLYYPAYTYGVSERVKNVQIGSLNSPADRFATFSEWYIVARRVPANQMLDATPN